MRWFSVDKYIPPACTYVLIRAINDSYDRYYIAMIENLNRIKELSEWVFANDQDFDSINFENYKVTHFCVLDPIEIEE